MSAKAPNTHSEYIDKIKGTVKASEREKGLYFKGTNRAKKAAYALYSAITRPSDLQATIKKVYTAESFLSLGEVDKK